MKLNELVLHTNRWVSDSSPIGSIVISSRIRLARNLEKFPFPHCMDLDAAKIVVSEVKEAATSTKNLKNSIFVNLKKASKLDRKFLMERYLISKEHAFSSQERAVLFDADEQVALMINEEDHLRLQVLTSGLQLDSLWQKINKIDDELEAKLKYAYLSDVGYLTACPTNTGTAMRASVMVHLPALVFTKSIEKILNSVRQIGLTLRGIYGEGTDIKSTFFQISNQITLGLTEEEIISNVGKAIRQIVDEEYNTRKLLVKDSKLQIENEVWRAYGILKNARIISFQEVINLFSALRFAIELNIITDISIDVLNELLVDVQPAHIQKMYGTDMNANERDIKRAELIRSKIK
ncbi:MAG: protein arginine kinase [Candidatus Firestonebacteria bacterium]